MIRVATLRASLWLTAPFNLAAAMIFAFPSSPPGTLLGLDAATDPLYRALCGFLVALFGLMYAWLAVQPEPRQPMLALGAAGKAGVFAIAVFLWAAGAVSAPMLALAAGDLGFATLWFLALRDGAANRRP